MPYRKPYDLSREFKGFRARIAARQTETSNSWFTAKDVDIPLRKLKRLAQWGRLEMKTERRRSIREPRYYFREPVETNVIDTA